MANENELAKPGSQEKIKEVFKAQEEGRKPQVSTAFQQALVGFLPTVVGALFEGSEGAAAGAQVGQQALSTLAQRDIASQKIAADVQKEKRDALVKDILIEKGQVFKREEAGTKRLFKGREQIAKDKADINKFTTNLRKEFEFNETTKQTAIIIQSFNRINAVAKNPSAAGDLATIFNFMKMQDPKSVVRESEFKTADDARAWLSKVESGEVKANVPGFVVKGIQKLQTGQRLLPEQRADFVNTAKSLKDAQLQSQEDLVNSQIRRIAEGSNLDVSKIINPAFNPVPVEDKKEDIIPKKINRNQQAIDFIKNNPNDPRVPKIKAKLKKQGLL